MFTRSTFLRGMGYYLTHVSPRGKDGDMGIFVSNCDFTPDSKTIARGVHVHVEL